MPTKKDRKAKFTPPRGMRDITPEAMAKRDYVYDRLRRMLRLFGYSLVEPTHIEKIETIFAKAGPAIEKEIYAFEDKGGRRLALRFDLTVGMARMVASNPDWPKPIRLAAISNVWRYDEPQYGRYRSVEQWDVEIFGTQNPAADAEVVELGCRLMESLGLSSYEILVNDRQILDAFLRTLDQGIDRAEVLRIMDKKGKISQDEMRRQLKELGLSTSAVDEVFEFCSVRGGLFQVCELLRSHPKIKNCPAIDRMERIGRILERSMGLDRIVFDLSLVRGLDYYTGFVFECFDTGDRDLGAVFGGGRFDGLVGIYGRDCPAVGCAGGTARLIISLESKGLLPKDLAFVPTACVCPVSEEEMPDAMAIASRLRRSGVAAVVDVTGRKLGKSLESANRAGHKYAIIVGRQDLKEGLVTLRDMTTGREERAKVEEITSAVLRRN